MVGTDGVGVPFDQDVWSLYDTTTDFAECDDLAEREPERLAEMIRLWWAQAGLYNVLPLDDVGLIKGISECYFSGDPVSRSDAREVAEAWKPWCSVATWYIWRSLDPLPVTY